MDVWTSTIPPCVEPRLHLCCQEAAKRQRGPTELTSLCELPFVLTPEAKGRIFRIEAAMEMNLQVRSWSINVRLPHHATPSRLMLPRALAWLLDTIVHASVVCTARLCFHMLRVALLMRHKVLGRCLARSDALI